MSIRKYLGEVFSDGHFIYFKYDAKRTKDCSTCEAVPKLLRRDEPRLDGEVRKACFLRKQKCVLQKKITVSSEPVQQRGA